MTEVAAESRVTAEITRAVTRGAARLFEDMGAAVVTELTLANGRRADILALAADGTLDLVEVKSGREDFLSDAKWPEYREFCDRFHFAVAPDFPMELLPGPETCGLIVADAWSGEVLRPAPAHRLSAARRKAVTIKLARLAATRLRQLTDPRI